MAMPDRTERKRPKHRKIKRELTPEDFKLIEQMACVESKGSLWAYRQYLNPNMLKGWWQHEVTLELHRFWLEYLAGRRPKLLLQSPPQHGKSLMVVDFLAWVLGHDPRLKVIFASYGDRLGVRANLRLQRIFANPKHRAIFGQIASPSHDVRRAGLRSNSQIIELLGGEGYFRNTTVGGGVTGETLDIGVIDDPIKGRAEASSQVTRDKTWGWLTDDFLTRFSDRGALLMIMTRWHLDDPAGRLIENYPGVRVCRYSAVAEADETHMGIDAQGMATAPFVRRIGDPLFPELKSAEFLAKQCRVMTQAGWQSVYQQAPIVVGGDMFPIHMVQVLPERPAAGQFKQVIRYWDKAGTHDGGAYSAGVLMARINDGTFCVVDVRRGRWSALERERMIQQTAEVDRKIYEPTRVIVEQEPGSGGKESAESTIRGLAGFPVEADRVSGAKEVRAEPFAAQWQAGNIKLVAAQWNRDYLDEHEHFPAGKYKDQVDASAGAFNKLASKYRYPSDMNWVS